MKSKLYPPKGVSFSDRAFCRKNGADFVPSIRFLKEAPFFLRCIRKVGPSRGHQRNRVHIRKQNRKQHCGARKSSTQHGHKALRCGIRERGK